MKMKKQLIIKLGVLCVLFFSICTQITQATNVVLPEYLQHTLTNNVNMVVQSETGTQRINTDCYYQAVSTTYEGGIKYDLTGQLVATVHLDGSTLEQTGYTMNITAVQYAYILSSDTSNPRNVQIKYETSLKTIQYDCGLFFPGYYHFAVGLSVNSLINNIMTTDPNATILFQLVLEDATIENLGVTFTEGTGYYSIGLEIRFGFTALIFDRTVERDTPENVTTTDTTTPYLKADDPSQPDDSESTSSTDTTDDIPTNQIDGYSPMAILGVIFVGCLIILRRKHL